METLKNPLKFTINCLFLTALFNQTIFKAAIIYYKSDINLKNENLYKFYFVMVVIGSAFCLTAIPRLIKFSKRTMLALLFLCFVSIFFVDKWPVLFFYIVLCSTYTSIFHAACSSYSLYVSKKHFGGSLTITKKLNLVVRVFEKFGNVFVHCLNSLNGLGKFLGVENFFFKFGISVFIGLSFFLILSTSFEIKQVQKTENKKNEKNYVLLAYLVSFLVIYHSFNNYHSVAQAVLLNKKKGKFSALKICGTACELALLIFEYAKPFLTEEAMIVSVVFFQLLVALFYSVLGNLHDNYLVLAIIEIVQRLSVICYTLALQNIYTSIFKFYMSSKDFYTLNAICMGVGFIIPYLFSVGVCSYCRFGFSGGNGDNVIKLTKGVYFCTSLLLCCGILISFLLSLRLRKENSRLGN